MRQRKYKRAIALLSRSLRIYYTARATLLLGRCHDHLGNKKQARAIFQRLPSRQRWRLARQLQTRGARRMTAGDYRRAIADLSLSLALRSSSATLFQLGQAYELGGQLAEARDTYRRLLAQKKLARRAVIRARLEAVEARLKGDSTTKPPTVGKTPPDTGKPPKVAKKGGPDDLPPSDDPRDAMIFGAKDKDDNVGGTPTKTELTGAAGKQGKLLGLSTDKLDIGASVLLRFDASFRARRARDAQRFNMPNLADLYMDGRPNQRLRVFLRTRISYNPALSGDQVAFSLIKFWLKFDIARRVYVTIGQQLVRWGPGQLWNPVDTLNLERRPVLSPFDARGGVPMVMLHFPVEALSWNFYVVGLLDKVNTFDKAGVASRGEFVFSTVELGIGGAYRESTGGKLTADISAGVWWFDLFSEVGVRFNDGERRVQASGGFSIGFPVFENDTLTIGGEYFYNQEGFSNPSFTQLLPDPITPSTTSLPFDPQKRLAQPLYLGRHYAAAFIYLPKPGKLEDWNFSFRGIMNLSDRSVVLQTIVQVQLLTYLQLQLITTGHLGSLGELRVGDDALPTDALERQAWRNALNGGKVLPTEMLDVSLWLTLNI